jgi:SAM-dependent methyltransferase
VSILQGIAKSYSVRARARRAELFRQRFAITPSTRILDLGSETGTAINSVLQGTAAAAANVYIADINEKQVNEGARRFGYQPVVIDESGRLPFEDGFFDIVYCSSVIEHVTVPKEEVWSLRSGSEFRRRALLRQQEFANEIRRLGRQYYVQTPYRHFLIESHSWLPGMAWLPRPVLVPTLRFTNRVWIKRSSPDWYLLNRREMAQLFPGAEIAEEKSFGLTKSLMAIRRAAD